MHVINYYFTYPGTRREWQFGIQTTNGKLVGFILGIPGHIYIKKEIIIFIHHMIKSHKKYNNKRLSYILTKELVRRANLVNKSINIGSESLIKACSYY